MKRREFIRNAGQGAAALSLGASALGALAQEKKKQANIKVGLYSITYLGIWYAGEALTLEGVMDRAVKYDYDGIEIDGKRPHGNPLDMPSSRCKEIKTKAEDKGLEIYAVSANNDFSSPIPEHRESQLVYMRELIKMTADLGAENLRVFLAWPGVTFHDGVCTYKTAKDIWQTTHYQYSREEIWNWCREGLIESCVWAEEHGITLALQNHAPVIRDWKDMVQMADEVNHPSLQMCLDVPIMPDKSPENINMAAQTVGSRQVLSHFGGEWGRDKDGQIIDIMEYRRQKDPDGKIIKEEFYPPFIKAMKNVGYNGYMSYELCHPLPVKNGKTVGIEYADQCAELACEMMKNLISNT
jgi:sugar phosphate isomerase/epimerase